MAIIFECPVENVGNKEITDRMTIGQRMRLGGLPCLIFPASVGDLVAESYQDVFELFHHVTTPSPSVNSVLLLRAFGEATAANAGGRSAADQRRDAGDTRTAAPASPVRYLAG
jgi:hypothetical protein